MKTTIERHEQKFCNVTIFTWEEWDDVEVGVLQYYNVEFPFESMKKYNGMTVVFSLEGQLTLFDKNDNEIIDMWVTDIPEVRNILLNKGKTLWHYVEKDGNPQEAGIYYVTLIFPEWKDGKKTGRYFAEVNSRYFADLDEEPDLKLWIMDGQPENGLAWIEECGSVKGETVYAWTDKIDIDIAVIPDGVRTEG